MRLSGGWNEPLNQWGFGVLNVSSRNLAVEQALLKSWFIYDILIVQMI